MDDNGESIMLCLVNNDPCSTILMTTSGQALYSITTPHTLPSSPATSSTTSPDSLCTNPHSSSWAPPQNGRSPAPTVPSSSSSPSQSPYQDSNLSAVSGDCHLQRGSETFVRRLDEVDITTGLIERTVGTIKEAEDETVTLELPGEKNFALEIPHASRSCHSSRRISQAASTEDGLCVGEDESRSYEERKDGPLSIDSWDFEGPDHKQYKWFLLGNSPIMAFIDRTMSYPIARYRRAKLGIISRQRKGFLEILPRGNTSMDLVVSTFVGFMKTCVLPAQAAPPELEDTPSPFRIDSAPSSPLPRQSPSASADIRANANAGSSPIIASSIPSRFQTAASLARKHSRSPPAVALGFTPWTGKPAPLPTSGLTEHK